MKYSKFLYFIIICWAITGNVSSAQTIANDFTDSLSKKFEYYNINKREGILYAHFDKTVYTNNENVWFTAYLLKNIKKHEGDKILAVILVRDDDHSIALKEKFVMDNGISFGNIFLTDTIPPGNYSFMLYTNNIFNGKPASLFVQQITIKNANAGSFSATLNLIDTGSSPLDGKRKVQLVTDTKGPKIISGATVMYYVGNKLHPIEYGKVKTDKAGQYVFNVPARGLASGNNLLEAQILYDKEVKTVKLIIPADDDRLAVKFFPEGGNLGDGILCTVGWEVKDLTGSPVKLKGILYKDGKPQDTINTDSYGMGRFRIIPRKGSNYYVRLLSSICKDSIYKLPAIVSGDPAITIKNAISDDTLNVIMRAKLKQMVYVVVHNYRTVFYAFPVEVPSTGIPIKIILDSLPNGIAEITVLDSLKRPCAERLFFAHYNRRDQLDITTDNYSYKTRQKVIVNLKLRDQNGKPATGLVSIACVRASRLEAQKTNDIQSYFYLNHYLGQLPVKQDYMGTKVTDKSYLENVLLIKGWRRYRWRELWDSKTADTALQQHPLIFSGAVTQYSLPLKKNTDVILFKDSALNILKTYPKGIFKVNYDELFTQENKKIHFYVSGGENSGYNITIDDPFDKISASLTANYQPPNPGWLLLNENDNEDIKGLENVIHLKEVKITGIKDTNVQDGGASGENACGDYVCIYNILNCPNHRNDPENVQPIAGHKYYYRGQPYYVYQGCMAEEDSHNHNKTMDGIFYSMEFYPADYGQFNPPAPEYLSTVYWKHLFKILPVANNQISFYTSDMTGPFKIIVQGIGENDVVSGEKTIVVKKP
jgi:hypothetical protein